MKLDWNTVGKHIPAIVQRPSITVGDKLATIVMLANRLRPDDHAAHRRRLDAINDDLRALAAIRQVEARLVEAMAEAFAAGIWAASEAGYVPADEEIARLLVLAKAQFGIATPEGEDLQRVASGQTIEVNG